MDTRQRNLPIKSRWVAGCFSALLLVLPVSAAYALKVQQAEQSELSPELLATFLDSFSDLEEGAKPNQQEISALINYAQRIERLGGDPRRVLWSVSRRWPTSYRDAETYLDATPGQKALATHPIRVQFGPGLLYHGMDDLDGAIRAGQLGGGIMLARVAWPYATGAFHRASSSPAIVVVPTELFNRYLREGRATLTQEGRHLVEPSPTITQPVPLHELVATGGSFWVSEDTYERYQRMLDETEPTNSILRERLRPLMDAHAISAILGLRHTILDEVARVKVAHETVGRHVLMHNLLIQIPLLEPFKATVGLEEDRQESSTFGSMS